MDEERVGNKDSILKSRKRLTALQTISTEERLRDIVRDDF